jgi:hypothetical protein
MHYPLPPGDAMSVEELSHLHRRYVDLSQRFRAAWVYHQFLQSLAKLFFEGFDDRFPPEFQRLYGELKEASQSLNASEAQRLATRFDGLEQELRELIRELLGEDSRVDPAYLRQFFHRFRSYDEKILLQLVRFYLYSHEGGPWDPDRQDKVDFLLTRLAEEEQEGSGLSVVRDRRHLREVFQSLASLTDVGPAEELEELRQEIEAVRARVLQVKGLDDLNDSQLVPRYRRLKHDLGSALFEPGLLLAVLETNLALKNTVRRLYRTEERRIFTEYQQIFDLEREVAVDVKLDGELTNFREDIERFERQLQSDDVRLDELARIRERVRTLVPRLTGKPAPDTSPGAAPPAPAPEPVTPTEVALGAARGAGPEPALPPAPRAKENEVVGDHFQRLLGALDGSTLGAPPKAVTLTPDLFPFHLEPREVVAYRRLAQLGEGGLGEEAERFILRAAALRVRMAEEVEEIRGLLDDTSRDPRRPIFARSRQSVACGDEFLGRFDHYIHQALLDGQPGEARQLDVLRMRLMREFSTLWLLAYRPLIADDAGSLEGSI